LSGETLSRSSGNTSLGKIRIPPMLQKGVQILEDECEEGENGRRQHVTLIKEAH
jgi:hypothetical protein